MFPLPPDRRCSVTVVAASSWLLPVASLNHEALYHLQQQQQQLPVLCTTHLSAEVLCTWSCCCSAALLIVSVSYHRDTNKDEWHSVSCCHGDAGTAVLHWPCLRLPSDLMKQITWRDPLRRSSGTLNVVQRWAEGCGFETWDDLSPELPVKL